MSSRREFLKIAGISAFALGAASCIARRGDVESATAPSPKPAVNGAYTTEPGQLTAKRWAMAIDTKRFAKPEDFTTVIQACHKEHNVPDIPGKQDVKWLWTDKYAHVFPDDSAHTYLPDQFLNGDFLLLCNHCENPPCVRVCPTGATFQTPDGIVAMDPHRCIGCRFCMAGCPFGARSFNFRDPQSYIKDPNPAYPMRTRGVVEKCTFCVERLAEGRLPACVEASNGAILFGDLNDPNSPVRQALAQRFSIRRKPTLGTLPGVYYIL